MKKLNLHGIYMLGKNLSPLSDLDENATIKSQVFSLFWAKNVLEDAIKSDSPLLAASRRAAGELLQQIKYAMPGSLDESMESDQPLNYWAHAIGRHLRDLESVLANEMPGCSAYIALQKGIYQTEGLIERAESHFPPEIANDLPKQAVDDLREAGKALAFELPTACSFHLWRAVETVTGKYYEALTNNTFDADSVQRNWGSRIKALQDRKAERSITEFLNHIKDQYRNPHTHPEYMVPISEAQMLFGAATSAITQLIGATQKLTGASGTLQLVQLAP